LAILVFAKVMSVSGYCTSSKSLGHVRSVRESVPCFGLKVSLKIGDFCVPLCLTTYTHFFGQFTLARILSDANIANHGLVGSNYGEAEVGPLNIRWEFEYYIYGSSRRYFEAKL
jgi:hypothetical protein